MNPTRDPSLSQDFFFQKTQEFFTTNNLPPAYSAEESIGVIKAADEMVDIFQKQFNQEGISYSEEFLLQLGSAIGTAFATVFNGEWKFSPQPNRWVVEFSTPKDSFISVNIFSKLEKRLNNGDEDSIGYLFEGIRKIYLEESNI